LVRPECWCVVVEMELAKNRRQTSLKSRTTPENNRWQSQCKFFLRLLSEQWHIGSMAHMPSGNTLGSITRRSHKSPTACSPRASPHSVRPALRDSNFPRTSPRPGGECRRHSGFLRSAPQPQLLGREKLETTAI